ncbi:MAG: putative porin [Gammaproteobacteria bacterium]
MNHPFTFHSALIALLAATASSVHADGNYQYEFLAERSNTDDDTSELDSTAIAARIYFDEVRVGNHPYEEAGFLSKTSNLIVGYGNSEFTFPTRNVDVDSLAVIGEYISPESSMILQAAYSNNKYDYSNGITGTADGDGVGIAIGAYLDSSSTILFSITSIKTDVMFTSPLQSYDIEQRSIDVAYKTVQEYNNNTATNVEFSVASSQVEISGSKGTNTIIDFAGDYYFNRATSVGGVFGLNSGDDRADEGKTFGLRATHYLTPYFSLYAEIDKFKADDKQAGEDADTTLIGATARF